MKSSANSYRLAVVSISLNVLLALLLSAICLNLSSKRIILSYDPVDPKESTNVVSESLPTGMSELPSAILKDSVDFENASAVFNAVHSAGKQKGANISPVGVTFIPAYIPPNTLLYHSTVSNEVPKSLEWIALDYEFSYFFAHHLSKRISPEHYDGDINPISESQQEISVIRSTRGKFREEKVSRASHSCFENPQSLGTPNCLESPRSESYSSANLYTFRSKVPLDKLIFLDGASAAKTTTGEMDQQMILSRQKDTHARVNEREAAQKICEWGKPFGLQGMIRLEIGFEVILCDFHKNIELVSNVTLNDAADLISLPHTQSLFPNEKAKQKSDFMGILESMAGLEHLKAGARVNEGEARILLDFSHMVTPLNKTWINPDPYLRRIHNLTWDMKEGIITELEHHLQNPVNPFQKTNWQIITNSIVDKVGPLLVNLNKTLSTFEHDSATDLSSSLKEISENLTKYTYNFVRRYSDKTIPDEKLKRQVALQTCLDDYVHYTYPITSDSEKLIYASLLRVHDAVIKKMFDLFDLGNMILHSFYAAPASTNYEEFRIKLNEQRDSLSQLIDFLNWPLFTECAQKCGWDEVCYVPTWGPSPTGWFEYNKPNRWFDFDGERNRIGHTLQCISNSDLMR